ncbi:MAG TPA: hypothetical protein VGK81_11595, partial [Anaerolineae bacterium]
MMSTPLAVLARCATPLLLLALMMACATAIRAESSDLVVLRPSDVQGDGKSALAPVNDECGAPAWQGLTLPADPGA